MNLKECPVFLRYSVAVILTPLFAFAASFGSGSLKSILRTIILFGAVTLFLPVANRLFQTNLKYKRIIILGGAFLTGVIACALAFPLVDSLIYKIHPILYILSGGVYLALFYEVFLLHCQRRFTWLFLFPASIVAGTIGGIFFALPLLFSPELFLSAIIAAYVNAIPIAFFLTALFTRLNPAYISPPDTKSDYVFFDTKLAVILVVLGSGFFASFAARYVLVEQEPKYLAVRKSDPSAIRTLSGRLESAQFTLDFVPGQPPVLTEVKNYRDNNVSPDGLITLQLQQSPRNTVFRNKDGKELYTVQDLLWDENWDGNKFFFRSARGVWDILTFQGDSKPSVQHVIADAIFLVPGGDSIFSALQNEFILKEKDAEPRLIYSAADFFQGVSTEYTPRFLTFTNGFSHIFYLCTRVLPFGHSTPTLFIFETATRKVYMLEHLYHCAFLPTPLQWKEKK
ncbi:MAG: hypothetical protein BWY31_02371 [Lentisphaerae bacterium ADurb.Bin242]|nr:MAG: hypothetical protein BWY31_02371 [Lentisphaerae bacterium ADurb.Bin242]